MSTPSEIIGAHKKHYLQRLISRNPQLHFFPGSSRLQLSELFAGILRNSPAVVAGRDARHASPTSAEQLLAHLCSSDDTRGTAIRGVTRSIQAKLEKLGRRAGDARHFSGQHTLFVGYPLLYAPVEGTKVLPLLAPIFFIPVTMECRGPDIHLSRLADQAGVQGDVADIRPNSLLNQWAQVVHDIALGTEESTKYLIENCPSNEAQQLSEVFGESVRILFEAWRGINARGVIDFANLDAAPTRDIAKSWQSEGRSPQVLNAAVIGVAEFKGQALLDDLGKLEQAARRPDAQIGLLDLFVRPRRPADHLTQTETPSSEQDRWLIGESDPSQERAVWQGRTAPLVVIQGPPGSGKSQTIVNLIADALSRRKTVGVFSQKRAALEVIRKRLVGMKLGDLCRLIDDPVKQRAGMIKAIKDTDSDWTDGAFAGLDSRRSERGSQIDSSERLIEGKLRPFHAQGTERPRYADSKARLFQLKAERFQSNFADWRDLLNEVRTILPRDLRMWGDVEQEVKSLSQQVLECEYFASPWRLHRTATPFDKAGAETALNNVLNYLYRREHVAPLHSNGQLNWMATHPFTKRYAFAFLTEVEREAQNCLLLALDGLRWLAERLEIAEAIHWTRMAYAGSLSLETYAPMVRTIGRAGDVKNTRELLSQNALGRVLEARFAVHAANWWQVVEAAAHDCSRQQLEQDHPGCYESVTRVKQELDNLGRMLKEKRSDDRSHLRWRFRRRLTHRNLLEDRQLLRLRGNSATRTRKTEIRDIFSSGFDSFAELHPVLLANPEVACSILPLQLGLFDLVIIDEASQMYVAEALPLLYRGKATIIAGDSKQMPPSDFFTLTDDDDSYENGVEDDEGGVVASNTGLIAALGEFCLIDAAELALPRGVDAQTLLNIHYRSAAQELVDFSNHAFYEGKLLAPPGNAAVNPLLPRPIVYQKVAGQFAGGINRVEADRIVSFLSLLWHPITPTVGVIVFNISQKAEVERQIEELARTDDRFKRRWMDEREREDEGEDVGFFVRSVEHVQGDERDLIILGTTYAGDSRNFGPLTKKDKGRRRLNVAITRAKRGMFVVSSLNLSAMASETEEEKEGRFLQLFLKYAKAVSESDQDTVESVLNTLNPSRKSAAREFAYDSPFEKEVRESLVASGFEVDAQVGESGFRIDLAVRVRNGAGYLCGIECDGAQYHSGWGVRTNDIWRQQLLESKGWKIFRVWSTDWFNDIDREKTKLLERLADLEGRASTDSTRLGQVLIDVATTATRRSGQGTLFVATSEESVAPTNPVEETPADRNEQSSANEGGDISNAPPSSEEPSVEIGDTVDYCFAEEPDDILSAMIVARQNFDSSTGVIPAHVPLARILLGMSVGDEEVLNVPPKGRRILRLMAIHKA